MLWPCWRTFEVSIVISCDFLSSTQSTATDTSVCSGGMLLRFVMICHMHFSDGRISQRLLSRRIQRNSTFQSVRERTKDSKDPKHIAADSITHENPGDDFQCAILDHVQHGNLQCCCSSLSAADFFAASLATIDNAVKSLRAGPSRKLTEEVDNR